MCCACLPWQLWVPVLVISVFWPLCERVVLLRILYLFPPETEHRLHLLRRREREKRKREKWETPSSPSLLAWRMSAWTQVCGTTRTVGTRAMQPKHVYCIYWSVLPKVISIKHVSNTVHKMSLLTSKVREYKKEMIKTYLSGDSDCGVPVIACE